jgi:hypothetical protein
LEESSAGAPPEFQQNARKFLYYQLFCASLPFDNVLEEDGVWRGFVRLKDIPWQSILPENSPTFRTIVSGILHEEPFVLPE